MDSPYSMEDALWVSTLASVLAVLLYWSDFVAFFGGMYFFVVAIMFVTAVFAVIYGLLIMLSLYRLMITPYADESWGLNLFFYLALCVVAMLFGTMSFAVGTMPVPLAAFSLAGAFSAGLSLLIWAAHSYAGKTWDTIPSLE